MLVFLSLSEFLLPFFLRIFELISLFSEFEIAEYSMNRPFEYEVALFLNESVEAPVGMELDWDEDEELKFVLSTLGLFVRYTDSVTLYGY